MGIDAKEGGNGVACEPSPTHPGQALPRPWARSFLGHARSWMLPGTTLLAVLATLQFLTLGGALPPRSFPLITDIFAALIHAGGTTQFWIAVGNTLAGWALGLGIAIGLAIPIGIVLGSSTLLYRGSRTLIEFLRPVPSVALIPLAVLILGMGMESKVFLAAFASFWPMLIQTIYGVQDTDPVAADTARTFGLSPLERFWHVTLPGTAPFIATGFRISSATALILAVTAELVIGSPGLGATIELARSGGDVPTAYAMIVATGILGWILNEAAMGVQRRVLHWHPSQRTGRKP
ncbi:hypothetical protein CDEF62S_03150 [Castellaniella defragrans]